MFGLIRLFISLRELSIILLSQTEILDIDYTSLPIFLSIVCIRLGGNQYTDALI